ncbi:MAG: hypothetical protein Ct9H300mP20_00430 [Gammaproteobacteria bacterium]|nr:MAG: hypothetical protein Ct9H300mP20_00430 [Gammaproteobacteria bacterium]
MLDFGIYSFNFFLLLLPNFIKEPGFEVNRPDAETANIQDNALFLLR